MAITNELLDELLKGCTWPVLGEAGLMKELKIRLMERLLGAEPTAHLGDEAGSEAPEEQTNRRNGVDEAGEGLGRGRLRAGVGEERPDRDRWCG